MYLAGSFLMFLAFMIVVGVLISDLALVALDPRIRLAGRGGAMNDAATAARGGRGHAGTPRFQGAVRSRVGRPPHARAGALLPRLAVDADVVEVQAPPRRGRVRDRPPAHVRLDARDARFWSRTTSIRGTPTSSMRRRRACTGCTTGTFVGPFVYPLVKTLNMETLRRDYTEDKSRALPAALLLLGRPLRILGTLRRVVPPRVPAGGRHAVSARHGPPGARCALAHLLRSADLADHRPPRHRSSASRSDSFFGGIAGYFGGLADIVIQRVIEIIRSFPGAAAVDGALRGAAGDVEPDPHLFRHHRDPGAARLDRARPRRALEAPRAARGGLLHGRAADGRKPQADHRRATCCRAS